MRCISQFSSAWKIIQVDKNEIGKQNFYKQDGKNPATISVTVKQIWFVCYCLKSLLKSNYVEDWAISQIEKSNEQPNYPKVV